MSVADTDVSEFMGADIWDIDSFDVALSIGLAFGGYVVGRFLVKKAARALSVAASGPQSTPPDWPKASPLANG